MVIGTNNNKTETEMKKGYKKITISADEFERLQAIKNAVGIYFAAQALIWCGQWTGANWTQLSMSTDEEGVQWIKAHHGSSVTIS